jgi:tRNA(Ile)-lysidine synthase
MAPARSLRALTGPELGRLLRPLDPAPRLGVAVSGGADSTALMLLLAEWRDWMEARGKDTPKITVLTVDHGLRPEAAEEAAQVASWAAALLLPHKVLTWDGVKPESNLQAEARTARYRLLTDWCRSGRGRVDLLTAHHLDDQAETFLMRLQRGSGVDGLSAMAPVRVHQGVRLLRPLLDVPRERLKTTLLKAGHAWVDDPSNEDDRFLRVQVRSALPVLEEFGLSRDRLVSTAKAMGRARAGLEFSTDVLERKAVRWQPFGFADVETACLQDVPDEIALRLLARLAQGVGGADYPPRLASLETLLEAVRGDALGRGRTLGGVKFTSRLAYFRVLREAAAVDEGLELVSGSPLVWDGRFDVRLTGRKTSGTVRALGRAGLRQVKEEGLPLPSDVPKLALETLPALWREDELLVQPQLAFFATGAPSFRSRFLGQI